MADEKKATRRRTTKRTAGGAHPKAEAADSPEDLKEKAAEVGVEVLSETEANAVAPNPEERPIKVQRFTPLLIEEHRAHQTGAKPQIEFEPDGIVTKAPERDAEPETEAPDGAPLKEFAAAEASQIEMAEDDHVKAQLALRDAENKRAAGDEEGARIAEEQAAAFEEAHRRNEDALAAAAGGVRPSDTTQEDPDGDETEVGDTA